MIGERRFLGRTTYPCGDEVGDDGRHARVPVLVVVRRVQVLARTRGIVVDAVLRCRCCDRRIAHHNHTAVSGDAAAAVAGGGCCNCSAAAGGSDDPLALSVVLAVAAAHVRAPQIAQHVTGRRVRA